MILADPSVNLLVRGGEALLSVRDEDEHRRLAHGERGLRLDHPGENLDASDCVDAGRVLRRPGQRLQPAGVHHHELSVAPERADVHAVTGDSGLVVHDGALRPRQAVEQRRLADVGATDDGDAGELIVRNLAPLTAALATALRFRQEVTIIGRVALHGGSGDVPFLHLVLVVIVVILIEVVVDVGVLVRHRRAQRLILGHLLRLLGLGVVLRTWRGSRRGQVLETGRAPCSRQARVKTRWRRREWSGGFGSFVAGRGAEGCARAGTGTRTGSCIEHPRTIVRG